MGETGEPDCGGGCGERYGSSFLIQVDNFWVLDRI